MTPAEVTTGRSAEAVRSQWIHTAGVLGVLAIAAAVPAIVVMETLAVGRVRADAFDVAGAPCPTVVRPGPALLGRRPMKTFTYGGVGFGRKTGHVTCMTLDEGGPFRRRSTRNCQFTAPWLISISSGGTTRYFAPGAGRPATVRVSAEGRASGILAGPARF